VSKERLLIDTNVFNHMLDRGVSAQELAERGDLFVTPVQRQELAATQNPARREELLRVFLSTPATEKPLQTAVWGFGSWGDGHAWGEEGEHYEGVKRDLESINRKQARSPGRFGDALTAEVALDLDCTLVTEDGSLGSVMKEKHGCRVLTLDELLALPKREP
jgi:predicted nucleic acid-binding protein